MKLKLALSSAALALATIATPAHADVLDYDVSNATNQTGCSHGLWVNSLRSGCDRRFSFQDDVTFSVDTHAGTGTFSGTAINAQGEVATLDLSLSGLIDTLDGTGFDYKARGGPYDPSVQDYFTSAMGTITVAGITYTLNPSDPFAGDTVFQFGIGANDKTMDFGGSSWLNMLDPHLNSIPHFDINFDLTHVPGTPVPAPAGLLLFGLGIAGAWGIRRRKQLAAA
ncbi:PEP-CTERM sorting domain-containing protein [Aurantiacibacter sediminis]|uniref:PEP-CTERM sorting domain-containing protein n=1 Tax=Aurantiacibacter sediminis TaxID=2793064 RepID=A0ABS0MZK8_9SPHN|nr:PEP-CTERM sorting domain-containing protein [Aurantiacibacter sediminis]MBH5321151.1 PEP-CTERM sorting domain-containing protein [Aurantiacibacter sediminis]